MGQFFDEEPPLGGDSGGAPEMGPEDDGVLVRTASKLRIRVKPIRHHLTPEGSACLGSFLNGELIARCVLPEETAAQFLRMGILDDPVHLALLMKEGEEGLDGKLLALTPVPEDMNNSRGSGEEAPWKQSVPSSNYEEAVAAEEDGEDDRVAAVFLGKVVRMEEDRKHPENLAMEAADVLRSVVKGDGREKAREAVDRLLEEVTESFEEDFREPPPEGDSGGDSDRDSPGGLDRES